MGLFIIFSTKTVPRPAFGSWIRGPGRLCHFFKRENESHRKPSKAIGIPSKAIGAPRRRGVSIYTGPEKHYICFKLYTNKDT
jgi:hypothetical protein